MSLDNLKEAADPSEYPLSAEKAKRGLGSSEWVAAKHTLMQEHRFGWLQAFQADASVDQIVYSVTTGLEKLEPPYDPYRLEFLVSSASTILDRCLIYRREMYDLEERAVKQALEYKLFIDQLGPLKAIERSERNEAQREIERLGQLAAKASFDKGGDLGTGFGVVSEASAKSLQSAVDGERERKANVEKKWELLTDFQNTLQARHSTPGHSLNYAERYARTRGFLEQDLGTAYQKIKCIAVAAKKILDVNVDLDPPKEYGYLDYLVTFVRKIIDKAELATLEELDFDHMVSLHVPRSLNGAAGNPLIGPEWDTIVVPASGKGLLTFTLDKEFPPGVRRLRMKAIGLSYVSNAPADTAARLRVTSAVIFPPRADNLFSPGSYRDRSPIIVERVAEFDPSQIRFQGADAVGNIDPRNGQWQIQLSSSMFFPDGGNHIREAASIKDVRLHLRLSAILDKSVASWSDFSW